MGPTVAVANRVRLQRMLREAEGYLELNMPRQALEILDRIDHPGTFRAQLLYLKGEAQRALEKYTEALPYLVESVDLAPSNIHAWLALGWCYKRIGQLPQAIESLLRAREIDATEPVIEYNLACYYSLQQAIPQALAHLARAIDQNPAYRDMVGAEPDFDPIRSDPAFRALVSVIV